MVVEEVLLGHVAEVRTRTVCDAVELRVDDGAGRPRVGHGHDVRGEFHVRHVRDAVSHPQRRRLNTPLLCFRNKRYTNSYMSRHDSSNLPS